MLKLNSIKKSNQSNNKINKLTRAQLSVMKGIQELEKVRDLGYEFWFPNPNNIMEINASFIGPEGTPYSGGMYLLNIKIDESSYPFKPPKIKFITKIYHPNISISGMISLNVLSVDYSPILTIYNLIESIQSFLSVPNPIDTENHEAGRLYLEDHELFEQIAIEWKIKYCPNFI